MSTDTVGNFKISCKNLELVNWSRDWMWLVRFPNGPDLFKSWFPCTEVNEDICNPENYSFSGGNTSFEVPQSFGLRKLSITFYEPMCLEISAWVYKWFNELVFGDFDYGVATLYESIQPIELFRFTFRGLQTYSAKYYVIPGGGFQMKNGNSSEITTNSLELTICGTEANIEPFAVDSIASNIVGSISSEITAYLKTAVQFGETNFGSSTNPENE